MKKIILFLILTLFAFSLLQAQAPDKTQIVLDYFDLYNEHQVDRIIEKISDDFRMYSVTKDTVTLDIDGQEALQKWLTGYFNDLPNVTSEISNIHESGNYVTFIETAHWGENRSQSSLAVYEILNEKIRRVWYYY